jgi:hypothetical protein
MNDFEKGKLYLLKHTRHTIIIGCDYSNIIWKHKLLHLENQEAVKEIIRKHFKKNCR